MKAIASINLDLLRSSVRIQRETIIALRATVKDLERADACHRNEIAELRGWLRDITGNEGWG